VAWGGVVVRSTAETLRVYVLLVLLAPGWVTTRVFSNKSLPHIHYVVFHQTNRIPLLTANGYSCRAYNQYKINKYRYIYVCMYIYILIIIMYVFHIITAVRRADDNNILLAIIIILLYILFTTLLQVYVDRRIRTDHDDNGDHFLLFQYLMSCNRS